MSRGRPRPADRNPRLELLVAVLTNHVNRPEALCAGQAPAFDPREVGEPAEDYERRAARAATVCGRCTERDSCPAPFG